MIADYVIKKTTPTAFPHLSHIQNTLSTIPLSQTWERGARQGGVRATVYDIQLRNAIIFRIITSTRGAEINLAFTHCLSLTPQTF